jgi:hypothetical protein
LTLHSQLFNLNSFLCSSCRCSSLNSLWTQSAFARNAMREKLMKPRLPSMIAYGWLAAALSSAAGGAALAADGADGTAASPCGDTWPAASPFPPIIAVGPVIWTGTQLVGIGSNTLTAQDVLLTSEDDLAWNQEPLGTTASLAAIAWDGTKLVGVGPNGAILTSPCEVPDCTGPEITMQPHSVALHPGQAARLTVRAAGHPTARLPVVPGCPWRRLGSGWRESIAALRRPSWRLEFLGPYFERLWPFRSHGGGHYGRSHRSPPPHAIDASRVDAALWLMARDG